MKTILKICDRCLCSKCGDTQCRKLACSIFNLDYPIKHCEGFLSEEKKEYDPVRYNLTKGTLLVVLIDRKHNRAVWQGYSSGLLGNKEFNNEAYLKKSVRSIFDKYKVFTEGYILTQDQPRED